MLHSHLSLNPHPEHSSKFGRKIPDFNNLINTTYDPTKQIPSTHKTIYQPTPSNQPQSRNQTLQTPILHIPTQNNNNLNNNNLNNINPSNPNPNQNINTILYDKISDKIYNHFKIKYPETIEASGFNKKTIIQILDQLSRKNGINSPISGNGNSGLGNNILDEKTISKVIDIIDHKFKTTIHSGNRQGVQYDTTNFSLDKETHIKSF